MFRLSFFILFYLINCLNGQDAPTSTLQNLLVQASSSSSSSSSLPDGFFNIGKTNQTSTDEILISNKLKSNQSVAESNQAYTNFALNNGNLVVNNSLGQPVGSLLGVSRNIATQKLNSSSSTGSSSTLILIMVSLVVVSCIIAIILTALFVMRRRFTIWRLNGSKSNSNGCNDGANGVLTNNTSSSDEEAKCEAINEKDSNAIQVPENNTNTNTEENQLTSVENKEAMEKITSQEEQTTEQPVQEAQATSEPQQATTTNTNLNEQNSSSSLIVNVLNELSESVASKLATKSPAKSSSNLNTVVDPEKQPLNNE